nr:MAG TPA: KH domain [Caudoviricetes sp.]
MEFYQGIICMVILCILFNGLVWITSKLDK